MKNFIIGFLITITVLNVVLSVLRHQHEREQDRKLAHIAKVYGILETMVDHMDHIGTNCINAQRVGRH